MSKGDNPKIETLHHGIFFLMDTEVLVLDKSFRSFEVDFKHI